MTNVTTATLLARYDRPRRRWSPPAVVLLLLFTIPSQLEAQEPARRLSLMPLGELSLSAGEAVTTGPEFRLLQSDETPVACMACGLERRVAAVVSGADTPPGQPEAPAEREAPSEAKKPRPLLAALVVGAQLAATAANSTFGYEHQAFHFTQEGFCGAGTADGGADKASHFADYYIISRELAFIFGKLGYSDNAARLMGFGSAVAGGVVNEIFDGFTRHGFSYEDLMMDVLGSGSAALILAGRLDDLLGVRTFPRARPDLLARRLLCGSRARRARPPARAQHWMTSVLALLRDLRDQGLHESEAKQQRQVGLEIGLDLEEIADAIKARRDTWWGYALHMVVDNVRFPYTAVGFRYDLNHHKWYGPDNGNYP